MRLVLVHGINNENHSVAEIETAWMTALRTEWTRQGLAALPHVPITTAYYADELARLTTTGRGAVAAGAAHAPSTTELELLQEYAAAGGVTDEDVRLALREQGIDVGRVEAGVPHEAWVIGLAIALERVLPSKGKYVARLFLKQAAVYLDRPGVRSIIKNIVRAQIFVDPGPMLVVAHSLGTLISYELLTERRPEELQVPLFCTLGSPLAVGIVGNYLGRGAGFPRPPVERWMNGAHPQDFVTLGRVLTRATIGFDGIENDTTANSGDDKHDILAYLAAPSIASTIHKTLIA